MVRDLPTEVPRPTRRDPKIRSKEDRRMKGRVIKRVWRSRGPLGRKVKHVAWGYSVWANGKRDRRYDSAWTREDAEKALAARILNVEQAEKPAAPSSGLTFAQAAELYLAAKRASGLYGATG